jgi:PKD repeat protein
MKNIHTYIIGITLVISCVSVLLSCGNWEIPTRKSQRSCTKPAGTLGAQAQQLKVAFSISDNTGTIDQINWDFGNGSTSATTGMTVVYTYPTSGTYTVKATLTNSCGQETILSQTLQVSVAVVPTVTLQAITTISTNSVAAGMTITSNGNATITEYGICYSPTNQLPDITKDPKISGVTAATLNASLPFSLTGLQPNTRYYARSYAVNSAGPGYSQVQNFLTGQNADVAIDNITAGITTADAQMRVTTLGNPVITAYGICYSSTITSPDLTNSISAAISNPIVGSTIINIKNLTPNTKYYYKLFIKDGVNPDHFSYFNVGTFTTQTDPVSQDLVASVSFTDKSLQDASGYNNHVKLVGSPTFTTDRKGQPNSAILLDGVKDYFYMDENDNSSLTPDALSISIWFKPVSFTHRMQLYNKSRFTDSAYEMYSALLKLENDTGPNTTIMTNIKQNSGCLPERGWLEFPFTSRIQLNTWYHLVFTYSGKSVRMYLNNTPWYSNDNLPNSSMDKCPGAELKFGAAIQGLNWYFDGAMDDIRIYKRALSASEVDALYKQ